MLQMDLNVMLVLFVSSTLEFRVPMQIVRKPRSTDYGRA